MRTELPRQYSCPIDANTNATSPKLISETGSRILSAKIGDRCLVSGKMISSPPIVTAAVTDGNRNWFHSRSVVVLRHAKSGAAPARNNRIRPSGVIHLLKKSGPTDTREPSIASEIVGNIVANSTKNAHASRI